MKKYRFFSMLLPMIVLLLTSEALAKTFNLMNLSGTDVNYTINQQVTYPDSLITSGVVQAGKSIKIHIPASQYTCGGFCPPEIILNGTSCKGGNLRNNLLNSSAYNTLYIYSTNNGRIACTLDAVRAYKATLSRINQIVTHPTATKP